ncbi:MAG: hypothetical protein ACLFT1_00610 [Desulfonatronovibrio sp.]
MIESLHIQPCASFQQGQRKQETIRKPESVKLVFSNLLLMQVSWFDNTAANCLSDLGGLNQNPLTICVDFKKKQVSPAQPHHRQGRDFDLDRLETSFCGSIVKFRNLLSRIQEETLP